MGNLVVWYAWKGRGKLTKPSKNAIGWCNWEVGHSRPSVASEQAMKVDCG